MKGIGVAAAIVVAVWALSLVRFLEEAEVSRPAQNYPGPGVPVRPGVEGRAYDPEEIHAAYVAGKRAWSRRVSPARNPHNQERDGELYAAWIRGYRVAESHG